MDDRTRWWAAYSSALGAVLFALLLSLAPQVAALAASYPIPTLLNRIRADTAPGGALGGVWLRRWASFPTIFWLRPSLAPAHVARFGAACAALFALGIGGKPLLLLALLALLSLATALGEYICFPWDCLVLEACWLSVVFAPARGAAPSAACVAAHRLLLFRLMFGMGKKKFGFKGKWREAGNVDFLKHFVLWQPLPTPLAWAAYNALPDAAWRIALHGMFVAECIVPFAFVLPLPHGVVRGAAAVTIVFQIGIAALGNYGVFQAATIALALSACSELRWGALLSAAGVDQAASALRLSALLASALLGAAHLPFDSYTTNYWLFGKLTIPGATRAPARALIALCRALAPWHVVHAYGVFGVAAPVESERGWRWLLRFEVRSDVGGGAGGDVAGAASPPGRRARFRSGVLRFKHYADGDDASLSWFAPHHPRIDHQIFYEAIGQRAGAFNLLNPYYWSTPGSDRSSTAVASAWIVRLARLVVDGDADARALFQPLPAATNVQRIDAIRVLRIRMRFSTAAERARSGKWFVEETRFAPHVLHVVTRASPAAPFALPQPKEWASANDQWRRRIVVGSSEKDALAQQCHQS